jgi:hypothetical protein
VSTMILTSRDRQGVPDALARKAAGHRRPGQEGAIARDRAGLAIIMGCWVLLTP